MLVDDDINGFEHGRDEFVPPDARLLRRETVRETLGGRVRGVHLSRGRVRVPKFEQRGGFVRGARARVRLIEGGSERLVRDGGERLEPHIRRGPNAAENRLGPG